MSTPKLNQTDAAARSIRSALAIGSSPPSRHLPGNRGGGPIRLTGAIQLMIHGACVHLCKLENTNSCSDVTPQRSNGRQYQRGYSRVPIVVWRTTLVCAPSADNS